MTGLTGTATGTCTGLPFGDGVNCIGNEWNFNRFTDYVHDSESNLEHTLFRQYSSTEGRFLTPDPYAGSMDLGSPQSMNRYSYVEGNPINFADPLGLRKICTLMSGGPDEAFGCITLFDLTDGQDTGELFGGSGGGGGGIGDLISKILGGGGLAGNTVPGNCFLPGACPSLPIPSILDFLPHIPGPGCDFGPCTDSTGTPLGIGNSFNPASTPLSATLLGKAIMDALPHQKEACELRKSGLGFCGVRFEFCKVFSRGERGKVECAYDLVSCNRATQELTPDCLLPLPGKPL
jgi:RHS repeat-associated protein